jgi:hypothetical protein
MTKKTILIAVLFIALAAGCKKKSDAPKNDTTVATKPEPATRPADPAPGSAAPPPVAGGSPIAVKDLGRYEANDMQETERAFEVTNHGKATVTHLQFYVFYYDKDKAPLNEGRGRPQAENYPEQIGIKPGETRVIPMGFEQGKEPEGTAFVEAALTKVEFADGTSWMNEKDGLPDRPMGGVH